MTKQELRKKFSADWKKHYELKVFREKGFGRKICSNCGKGFWTLDSKKKLCGDSTCEEYSFIGNRTADWDYIKCWKEYEKFFEKHGHASVARYPVLCRWRPDLYFTIASITDFQRIDNGKIVFEYPEKRLIVPQFCLRFVDIPNVGVTGRHFTGFVMPGQHAFNDYWKDECIQLNFNFLTSVFKIKPEKLTYVEDVWAMPDLSAYGPSLESFSKGLEFVNSVFMQYTSENGVEKELPIKVIDVGWGLERMVWYAQGSPTALDVAFGPVMDKMKKKSGVEYDKDLFLRYSKISGGLNIEDVHNIKKAKIEVAKKLGVSLDELGKKIEPIQALYSIADHSRAVAMAIADGGLPSNVGGGYNLRVILRRALSFIDEFNFPFKFEDIAEWHGDYLKPLFPDISENINEISEIVQFEEKKYKQTLKRARQKVKVFLEKTEKFDTGVLTRFYESDGITPELIEEVANKMKKKVEIPPDFYKKMSEKHETAKKEIEKGFGVDISGLPETKTLYYTDELDFKARVLGVFEKEGNHWVVLDKTAFYPESGGQAYDQGTLGGVKVLEVRKVGNVIIHRVDKRLKKGESLLGKVDKKRRKQLKQHHTATHIVNGAARRALGNHVWQTGAEKTVEKGRLDISHYDILSKDQVDKIQELANKVIREKRKIIIKEMPRNKAEELYGFRLYQGGAVPSKIIRVVDIKDWDVEACGGTHLKNTGDVEVIKLLKSEKKQDGVIRLEYVAGQKVLEELKKKEEILRKTAEVLNTDMDKLVKTAERMASEWKAQRKEIERLKKGIAKKVLGKESVQMISKADMKMLQNIGRRKVKNDPSSCVVLLSEGMVFGIRGSKCEKTEEEIRKIVEEASKIMGGKAGGRNNEYKGGGPRKDKTEEAYKKVKKMLE